MRRYIITEPLREAILQLVLHSTNHSHTFMQINDIMRSLQSLPEHVDAEPVKDVAN